jgi:hypothetical protein
VKRLAIALIILAACGGAAPRVVAPRGGAVVTPMPSSTQVAPGPSAAELDDHALLLLIAAKVFTTQEMPFVCAALRGQGSRAFLQCGRFGSVKAPSK